MRKACDWIGTVLLCMAPFGIDTAAGKTAAIVGLALLTLQALQYRAWNLVTLNAIGIIGYCYALFV